MIGPELPPAPPDGRATSRSPTPTATATRDGVQERRRRRRRQRPARPTREEIGSSSIPARPTPTATASRTATSTSPRSDLNDDEYQAPNGYLPYPAKRPYPNPLVRPTPTVDYDGDGLTLKEEYELWKLHRRPAALPRDARPAELLGRRAVLARAPASTARAAARRRWPPPATPSGRVPGLGGRQRLRHACCVPPTAAPGTTARGRRFDIRDVDRSGDVDDAERRRLPRAEATYYDLDGDGYALRRRARRGRRRPHELRRDPRPHDRRATGRAATTKEKPYPVEYAGTDLDDRGHRRRRHARRRGRPGPRRPPEHHGAQPQHGLGRRDWAATTRPCRRRPARRTASTGRTRTTASRTCSTRACPTRPRRPQPVPPVRGRAPATRGWAPWARQVDKYYYVWN